MIDYNKYSLKHHWTPKALLFPFTWATPEGQTGQGETWIPRFVLDKHEDPCMWKVQRIGDEIPVPFETVKVTIMGRTYERETGGYTVLLPEPEPAVLSHKPEGK